MNFLKLFKALVFAGALFSISAVAKKVNKETYQDIVEKVQNLLINKDRANALVLLNQSILKEGPKSPSGKELIKTLNQSSKIFIYEQTQQLYEVAIANWVTNYTAALENLNLALKKEDDNLEVILLKVRAHLSLNECRDARAFIKKIDEINPYEEELSLLYAQLNICEKNYDEFYKIFSVNKTESVEWQQLFLIYAINKSLPNQNILLDKIKKANKYFPEIYYWEWKKNNKPEIAKKYINLCKNMSDLTKRSLVRFIYVCSGAIEVEKIIN